MPRRFFAPSAVASAAGLAFAACNAINGASDLTVGEGTPRKDAATEAAPPEPDDGGTTGAVSCGDQRVCLTTPPGWSPLVLVQGAANTLCPTTWAQKTPAKAVSGLSKCACRCAPTFGSGSCEGVVTLVSGIAPCTSMAGSSVDVSAPPDGGCAPVAVAAFTPNVRAKVVGQAPTSCGPQLAIDAPQPIDVALCAGAEVTTSPKCKAEESCVPAVARGARLCIARDGEIECPAGGWTRWSTGTNPTDTRACEGCTCAPDPSGCAKGELSFFSQDGCVGANGAVMTDEVCKPSTVTAAAKSVRFRAVTGCAVTQEPKVAGTLAFTGARTVCCL